MTAFFEFCTDSKAHGKNVVDIDTGLPDVRVEEPLPLPRTCPAPAHKAKKPTPTSLRESLSAPVQKAKSPKAFKPLTRIPTAACLEVKDEDAQPQQGKFEINLLKGEGDIVGLDADWGDMTCLRIVSINAGLIVKWNQSNPNQKVDVGDAIVEVNGATGDSKTLLERLKDNTNLSLTIQKGDGSRDGSPNGEERKHDPERAGIELLVEAASDGLLANTKLMFYMNWKTKK